MKDTCRRDPKSFNIADYVQGGFAQVKAMEWPMIDFDYLRSTAYLFYVRIAMVLSELLRATLHSEFIDYILDVSEKTLMKDILNIESETTDRICGSCMGGALQTSPNGHLRLRTRELLGKAAIWKYPHGRIDFHERFAVLLRQSGIIA